MLGKNSLTLLTVTPCLFAATASADPFGVEAPRVECAGAFSADVMAPASRSSSPSSRSAALPEPRAANAFGIRTWPGGRIPVLIPPGFSNTFRARFMAACQEWTNATGVYCVPRTDEQAYLLVGNDRA